MKRVKQGHTKFKVVVYEPGKIEGYDDRHVACIYTCFVTKVEGNQISYATENYPYLCGPKFWSKLFPTRRKALRYAQQQIDKINKGTSE